MPTRRAAAPRRIPFHLALLARGRLAPDREVGGVALAVDGIDAAFALIAAVAREAAVLSDRRRVEIEAAVEFVAMPVGDRLCERDNLRDIVGRQRPVRRLDRQSSV